MVIINRSRRSGIILTQAAITARVILMDEGPLDVQEIPVKQLRKEYFDMPNYPEIKAATHFLNHNAGVTLRAQRELNRICGNKAAELGVDVVPVEPCKVGNRGAVRDQIWAVGDAIWEAAGKPTDKKVVLKLRKVAMEQLEKEFGVKVTTSSNELGNWMKARLA